MHERGRFAISFELSEPVNVEGHIGLRVCSHWHAGMTQWLVSAVVLARRHGHWLMDVVALACWHGHTSLRTRSR